MFLGSSGLFLAPVEARHSLILVPAELAHEHAHFLWPLSPDPLLGTISTGRFQRLSAYGRGIPPAFASSFPWSPYENVTSLLWGVCVRRQDSLFHGCYSGLFHYLSDTPTPRFIQSETEMHPFLGSSVFPPASNIRRAPNVSQGNLWHFRTRRLQQTNGSIGGRVVVLSVGPTSPQEAANGSSVEGTV